jgi:GrpB-like predicted nucleotidyltransferase (UPF0157 family)
MTSVNEPVQVVEYSEGWPALFASERERLVVNPGLRSDQILHIGSTAVRGLAAKPIIDVMLGVASYPPSVSIIAGVVNLGYEALGECGVSGRWHFRRRGQVSFNLHAVQLNGQHSGGGRTSAHGNQLLRRTRDRRFVDWWKHSGRKTGWP